MKHVIVLGAGRVGGAIARDLVADFKVTVVDKFPAVLGRMRALGLSTREANLAVPEGVQAAVADADIVVGAVPGFMGFATAKAVLAAGKTLVDISFFDEDCFLLDELARSQGLTAIVDCGIAPGCGNIILGDTARQLDHVTRFECLVGGLPVVRRWPFEYKAGFSPIDVIEEYTRPARYVKEGKIVTLPALSEPELLDFDGVGTVESFNTDGLRSLIHTFPGVPEMKEKTLRYPGHIELMRVFRETGLFSKEPLKVNGQSVVPLDVTGALLFPQWTYREDEADLTIMRITVEGRKDGRPVKRVLEMLDHYDPATKITSMARTTGYTCSAVVRLVADGRFTRQGICPPEYIGRQEGAWDFVRSRLAERNVVFREH